MQRGPQSHPSGCTHEVGSGQKHFPDALPGHCSLKDGLWLFCIWHSVEHPPESVGQHPLGCIKTGTWSVLRQPTLQFVHRGQWSSSGGTVVKDLHAWLSKLVPALIIQHIMSCMNITKPQGSVGSQAKCERRHDPTSNMSCWSQGRGSCSLCNTWIWPNETRPHWRSEQMYDHHTRSPVQMQRLSLRSRVTWWWIQDRRQSRGCGSHQLPFP